MQKLEPEGTQTLNNSQAEDFSCAPDRTQRRLLSIGVDVVVPRELQGLVFAYRSESGVRSTAWLEVRPPDFLGYFDKRGRRSRAVGPVSFERRFETVFSSADETSQEGHVGRQCRAWMTPLPVLVLLS